jgi:hypothetical protein
LILNVGDDVLLDHTILIFNECQEAVQHGLTLGSPHSLTTLTELVDLSIHERSHFGEVCLKFCVIGLALDSLSISEEFAEASSCFKHSRSVPLCLLTLPIGNHLDSLVPGVILHTQSRVNDGERA